MNEQDFQELFAEIAAIGLEIAAAKNTFLRELRLSRCKVTITTRSGRTIDIHGANWP